MHGIIYGLSKTIQELYNIWELHNIIWNQEVKYLQLFFSQDHCCHLEVFCGFLWILEFFFFCFYGKCHWNLDRDFNISMGFPNGSVVICLQSMQEVRVQSLGWTDPRVKEMATHSNIPAWEISWTEKSAGYSLWSCKKNWTWLSA